MEFYPANKAYQTMPLFGFRTFLKIAGSDGAPGIYEPFSACCTSGPTLLELMFIAASELALEETNGALWPAGHRPLLHAARRAVRRPRAARVHHARISAASRCHSKLLDGMPAASFPSAWATRSSKTSGGPPKPGWRSTTTSRACPFTACRQAWATRPRLRPVEAGPFLPGICPRIRPARSGRRSLTRPSSLELTRPSARPIGFARPRWPIFFNEATNCRSQDAARSLARRSIWQPGEAITLDSVYGACQQYVELPAVRRSRVKRLTLE